MLELKNVAVRLGDFSLQDVSFAVEQGDYFVLLGLSGAGKTVLLEIIAGLTAPDSGKIVLDNQDIGRKRVGQRGVGLVYQDQSLFPHMSVARNIAYPLKCRHLSANARRQRVEDLAEQIGIAHLLDRSPGTLSIGEAQRVALARTLAVKPTLLLLDEPLASLDIQSKARMRTLLRELNEQGQTIIHVTHDYEEAVALAKHIAVVENGSVVQTGTTDDIFHRPLSEFVANFTGIRNFYRGHLTPLSDDLATFTASSDLSFEVASVEREGEGCIILRSEDVTVSKTEPTSSARNHFQGTVTSIEPARIGLEVTVDIGIPISALITRESSESLRLVKGEKVWVNFKATAVQYIPE